MSWTQVQSSRNHLLCTEVVDADGDPHVAIKRELDVVLALLWLFFLTFTYLSCRVGFNLDKVKRVASYVDQAFEGLCWLVGLWRWVGERNRFAAQKVQVRVVSEQEGLRLWRIKLLTAHDEMRSKVVARFGRVPEILP